MLRAEERFARIIFEKSLVLLKWNEEAFYNSRLQPFERKRELPAMGMEGEHSERRSTKKGGSVHTWEGGRYGQ